jgi:ABC-type transporter Mla subunit MlaD
MYEMATAKKKVPTKRKAAPSKKAAAPKIPARKRKPARSDFFKSALDDARGQIDEFVDSVKLKAKQMAAKEKLIQKKAELAASAEIDKARHLAQQAEKWMRARIKSDAKTISKLEKKLSRQLHDIERKLRAQAKAAENKASKQGKSLKKMFESETKRVFGKAGAKTRATPARKKVASPKKKAIATKTKARVKK